MLIELASLENGSLDVEEYGSGRWWGMKVGGAGDIKAHHYQVIEKFPPPPCGSLAKMPRRTATAEATSPAKIMLAGIELSDD